jgi:hypothetical protein
MGVRPMPDVAQGTLVQEHRRSEVGVLCANTSNQRLAPGVHRLNDPRGSISTLRNAEAHRSNCVKPNDKSARGVRWMT